MNYEHFEMCLFCIRLVTNDNIIKLSLPCSILDYKRKAADLTIPVDVALVLRFSRVRISHAVL